MNQKASFVRVINRPILVFKVILLLLFVAITTLQYHFFDVDIGIFLVLGLFFSIAWIFSKPKELPTYKNTFFKTFLILFSVAFPVFISRFVEIGVALIVFAQTAIFSVLLLLPKAIETTTPSDEVKMEIPPTVCFLMYMFSLVIAIIAGRFFSHFAITFFVVFVVSLVLVSPAILRFLPSESNNLLTFMFFTIALFPPMIFYIITEVIANYLAYLGT